LLLVIDLNENFSSEKILSVNDNVSYYFKKKILFQEWNITIGQAQEILQAPSIMTYS